jgi:hypothetical protein
MPQPYRRMGFQRGKQRKGTGKEQVDGLRIDGSRGITGQVISLVGGLFVTGGHFIRMGAQTKGVLGFEAAKLWPGSHSGFIWVVA